ncbi:MAG: permease-like cell division protein FtsX [Cyclobacteriaceae bacterium]|nr:ABC transporter permease [Cyclobacteriaceae bacterium]MCH8516701.1 permease-like cell division protein FtsX [Cyclobacteriaceae bacterium]
MKTSKIRKRKLGSYPFLSVIFSISLALFVIGLTGLLLVHAGALSRIIKENIEIQVFLNRNVTESDRYKLERSLSEKPFVKKEKGKALIEFLSKEEAAKAFIEATGEDFLSFLGDNPLRDAYLLRLDPEYYEKDQLSEIKQSIESINSVFEVVYLESLIESINQNITKITLILGIFGLILITASVVLINNTIKLALFSQRFLIRSMQLVGATQNFIKRPFLYRSFLHGLMGSLIATVLLLMITFSAYRQIPDLEILRDDKALLMLAGALFIVGMAIGVLSTLSAMRKYMRMSLDELY